MLTPVTQKMVYFQFLYCTYESSGESVHGERFQVDGSFIARVQLAANVIPDRERSKKKTMRHLDSGINQCFTPERI